MVTGGAGRVYLVFLEDLVARHLHTNPIDKYGV